MRTEINPFCLVFLGLVFLVTGDGNFFCFASS